MILKNFDTPTDVFIVGCDIHENNQWTGDFMITDDEHIFSVLMDNKIQNRLTSNGFVNIMSRQEFEKHKEYFAEELIDKDFLMLPDFQGEIGVKVVFLMEGEKPNIHIEELDLNEYLACQEGFSDYHDKSYAVEYCAVVPIGTEICLGRYEEDGNAWEVQRWIEV